MPTAFKHIGVFPEQASNWQVVADLRADLGDEPKLLNLFGYTGAASVLAASVATTSPTSTPRASRSRGWRTTWPRARCPLRRCAGYSTTPWVSPPVRCAEVAAAR
ncbi:MAG: hypothetical protein R3E96_05475 [Planctomycetota bacterium]